jgi:putative transcriptional regulator
MTPGPTGPHSRRAAVRLIAGGALSAAGAPALARRTDAPEGGSLRTRLLVATARLRSPLFGQTVILLAAHDRDGAFGLVVNRPMDRVPWADLLERLGIEAPQAEGRARLFYGGPVQPGRLFVLHSGNASGDDAEAVTDAIALSTGGRVLSDLAAGRGPERSRILLGYAGWGPGQLDREIRRGDWFTIANDPRLVFDPDPAGTWQDARARRGIDL